MMTKEKFSLATMTHAGLILLIVLLGLSGCGSSSGSKTFPSAAANPAVPLNQGAVNLVVAQNGSLLRLDSNGQNPVGLTRGFRDEDPFFSPDGTNLIFSRIKTDGTGTADVYRIQLDGSGLINLTPGFPSAALDPVYSSDGQRIAFSAQVADNVFDLYVMNADGSDLRVVATGSGQDRQPSFSADATTLVFERGRKISTVDIASGRVTDLTDGTFLDSQPSFCPPGDVVMFLRNGDIWSIQKGALGQVTVTPADEEFAAVHSPDSSRIFYLVADQSMRTQSSQDSPLTGDIYSSQPDGSDRQRVSTGLKASFLAAGPTAAKATSKDTFTLSVENGSPYAASEVFVHIEGQNEPPTGNPSDVYWYYLANPGDPSLTAFDRTPSTLLKKNPDGSFVGNEKYFFTLDKMTPAGGKVYTMEVPRQNLYSGRIYVSFGQHLPGVAINASGYAFDVTSGGAPTGVGTPVTSSVSGTGMSGADGKQISALSIDATTQIYPGEPVSGTGVPQGTVVIKVLGKTQLELSQPLAPNSSVSLRFDAPPFTGKALQGASFTGSPDYLIPWEFMELSATRDRTQKDPWYTLFVNTSVVDFYSIGLGMDVEFTDNTVKRVGFEDGARAKILTDFNSLSETEKGFKGFVVTQIPDSVPADKRSNPLFDTSVTDIKKILRVLGPQNILQFKGPTDPFHQYLAPAIDAAWTEYQSTVLNITDNLPGHNPYGFTYTGNLITGGILKLTNTAVPSGQSGLGEVSNLGKPSTFVVFKCDDTKGGNDSYANDGSDAHKRLGSLLLAALNRGVFADYLSWSNDKGGVATFYKAANSLYNHYPAILHQYAIGGKVYGFGYDDIYGQDPTIAGSIGKTQGGQDPPGGPGISKVTVKIPSFDKF